MVTMYEMIDRICGDDKTLCEALTDYYRQVERSVSADDKTIGEHLWDRLQQEYEAGHLGYVITERGQMVPKGRRVMVDGAIFRVYAGMGRDDDPVKYRPAVGNYPERVSINIGPYLCKYVSERGTGDVYNTDYNELAYNILLNSREDLISRVNYAVMRQAQKSDMIDYSIDQMKQMYSTDSNISETV